MLPQKRPGLGNMFHNGNATILGATMAAAWLAIAGPALADPPVLGPFTYDGSQGHDQDTPVGKYRQILKTPTATLQELEVHVTTLNPGQWSHQPHHHYNEELVIIRQGTVETLSGGVWKRLGPGSFIFNASNSVHALRNVGDTAAIYDVVAWTPKGAPPGANTPIAAGQ